MRLILLSLILVLSFNAFAQKSEIKEVEKIEANRTEARIKGDNETMNKLVAGDFVGVNRFGQLRNRKYATNGKPLPSLVNEDLNVRVFGDTAVAIGIASFTREGINYVTRFTRVWQKRNGLWQNVSHQGTAIGDNSDDDKITEAEARQRLEDWKNAFLNHDVTALEGILDEEWNYGGSGSKQESVEGFRNTKDRFIKVTFSDVKVRVFGNIAIVTAKEEMVIRNAEGKINTGKLKFTDVFRKNNGKITAIATHTSPIE